MKVAVIADIHTNHLAFDLVLEDMKKRCIDKIVFLGDYITDGDGGSEVLKLVKDLGDHVVLGNREKYILDFDENKRGYINYDTIADTYDSLSEMDKDYIKSMKEYEIVDLEGHRVLLIHGHQYFKYNMPLENFYDALIEAYDFEVCLYGHTHEIDDTIYRGRRFVNPGALSQPSDTPSYKYAILDIGEEIRLERIEFPTKDTFDELLKSYKRTDYYHKHKIWSDLTLLLTRDAVNYLNDFVEIFNERLKDIDETDKDAYNLLYEKCFEEYAKNLDLP